MPSSICLNEAPSPASVDYDTTDSEIVKRAMRVKVLYTFDNHNKTNCLARLPNLLPIPVVAVDEQTQIGIIELKTCIQAIVSASPELVSSLENDYTVYAYDYSEHDTPLVGQGMLSRVLALDSLSPRASVGPSGTMITGRVCKNLVALFSCGARETLEVKLKLVPVHKQHQNDYDKVMEMYRDNSFSPATAMDLDLSASSLGLLSSNLNLIGQSPLGSAPQPTIASRSNFNMTNMGSLDSIQDMLTPNFTTQDHYRSHSSSVHGGNIGGSRCNTPIGNIHPGSPNPGQISRPSSRTSVKQSCTGTAPDDNSANEGPARKKVRLTHTEWRGLSNFGIQSDSLRVTASNIASIRGFRPSFLETESGADEMLPRAPTPRPSSKRLHPTAISSKPVQPRPSSLSEYQNFGPFSDASALDDGTGSIISGPYMPSSPPIFDLTDDCTFNISPSSPVRPESLLLQDSGFYTDTATEQYNADSGNPCLTNEPPISKLDRHEKWKETMMRKRAQVDWAVTTIEPSQVPSSGPLDEQGLVSRSRARSALGITCRDRPSKKKKTQTPAGGSDLHSVPSEQMPNSTRCTRGPSQEFHDDEETCSVLHEPVSTLASELVNAAEKLQAGSSSNQLSGPLSTNVKLPRKNAASRQGKRPPLGALPRVNTSSVIFSDVEDTPVDGNLQKPTSGAIRSNSISRRLQSDIATGNAITYCMNCGAIDTVTWRPYWYRVEMGTGDGVVPDDENGIHCVHPVSRGLDGNVVTYRIYKKWTSLKAEEKDLYQKWDLCNPCGDYMRKYRLHRPERFWDKPAPKEASKKGSGRGRNRKKNAIASAMDGNMESPNFMDILSPRSDTTNNAPHPVQSVHEHAPSFTTVTCPPQVPQDVSVNQPQPDQDATEPSDEVESKPAQIQVEESKPDMAQADPGSPAKPIRRLLFPSPRKSGEFKSLSLTASPSRAHVVDESHSLRPKTPCQEMKQEHANKENQPPVSQADDGLANFFDFDATPLISRSTSRAISVLNKTPGSSARCGTTRNALVQVTQTTQGPITPSRGSSKSLASPFVAAPMTWTPLTKSLLEGLTSSPNAALDMRGLFGSPLIMNGNKNAFPFDRDDMSSANEQAVLYSIEADNSRRLPSSSPLSRGLTGTVSNSLFNLYEDDTATTREFSGFDLTSLATIGPDVKSSAPSTEAARKSVDEVPLI